MKTFLRFARHGIFVVISLVAGFVGVFLVGVPTMGDNPGAIFGGIACFVLSLFSFLTLEALWEGRLFRGGRWREVILEITFSYAAAYLAIKVTERLGWAMLDSLFLLDAYPIIFAVFGFLFLDAAFYWLGKAAFWRLRAR